MNTPFTLYRFAAAAKTITLTGVDVDLSRLRGVHNQTRGVWYFLPGDTIYIPTVTAPNVITLNAGVDTTGHADSDKLIILYDVPEDHIDVWRTTFGRVYTNAVDPRFFNLLQTGGGMTVNQIGGNLVVACGTTTNSETILRSVRPFSGSNILRYISTLSQRNANNNCIVELVDIIGDALAFTINSATSVTVTVPAGTLDTTNVGGQMHIGRITGAAGIPILATVAGVSGNNVTFTVAGWPATGTGTCSVFGLNAVEFRYTGTTNTVVSMLSRRMGYQTAEGITITATSAASLVEANIFAGTRMNFHERVITSLTTGVSTFRGDRVVNLPDEDTELYLQVRALNGTAAPTGTTWTMGIMSVSDLAIQPVAIAQVESGARQQTESTINGIPAVSQSGTWNVGLNAGTNLASDVGLQYRGTVTGAGTAVPINSPATPASQSIKGSAGKLLGYRLTNTGAITEFVKVFNIATAVTPGTTAAFIEIAIPPGQTVGDNYEGGLAMVSGIQVMVTGARGLTNNTAITADTVTGYIAFA